jgi:integrase/recombinase XerD
LDGLRLPKPNQRKQTVALYLLLLGAQMAQAKTLTAAELRRATDYIATRPHAARNRAMLLTTHLAGLRVGEVALLSWSDAVDSNGQVREEIRLNADQTKGRHPRTVYVSPKLRKELQAYVNSIPARAPEAAFFYTQKHPRRGFTPNTLTQLFFNLYRGAGIEGASSHSGRRTFATSLSSKGASIRVLMKLMGHRNISTTIGYVDASDDMLRRAVELA